jgi:hypothetical protein
VLDTDHQHDVVPVVLQEPDQQRTLTVGLQAGDGPLTVEAGTDPANAHSAGKPRGQGLDLDDLPRR